MASCSDYEGTYTVTQSTCSSGCTIPPNATLEVVCSPTMQLLVDSTGHSASINASGQLEVSSLGLVASVTGTAPNRVLFGVAESSSFDNGGTEVWGAEQG